MFIPTQCIAALNAARCSAQFSLCILHTAHYTEHSTKCTLHTAHCKLHTAQCTCVGWAPFSGLLPVPAGCPVPAHTGSTRAPGAGLDLWDYSMCPSLVSGLYLFRIIVWCWSLQEFWCEASFSKVIEVSESNFGHRTFFVCGLDFIILIFARSQCWVRIYQFLFGLRYNWLLALGFNTFLVKCIPLLPWCTETPVRRLFIYRPYSLNLVLWPSQFGVRIIPVLCKNASSFAL